MPRHSCLRIRPALLALALVLVLSVPARADVEYVNDAIQAAIGMARKAKDATGYGPTNDGFALFGGWINKGKELTYGTELKKGRSYLLIGGAEKAAKELNILIHNEDGSSELHNDEKDNTPVVHVQPADTMQVVIHLSLADSDEDEPCFCILVILDDASKGSMDSLSAASHNLTSQIDDLQQTQPSWVFDQSGETISICAALLKKDEAVKLGRHFDEGAYLFPLVADEHCKALELHLMQGEKTIAADTDKDKVAVVKVTVESGPAQLDMILHNADSDAPTFAIAGILQEVKK